MALSLAGRGFAFRARRLGVASPVGVNAQVLDSRPRGSNADRPVAIDARGDRRSRRRGHRRARRRSAARSISRTRSRTRGRRSRWRGQRRLDASSSAAGVVRQARSRRAEDPSDSASPVRSFVQLVQKAMGLTADGVDLNALPLGVVDTVVEPKKVFGDDGENADGGCQGRPVAGGEWSKVVDSVDVDLALLLVSVVAVVRCARS